MWEVVLPLLGFLIGIVAAMTGVGGGIFIVPLLTLVFGFVPAHAVGTSLAVIVFTAVAASFGYWRQKLVFFRAGLLLAVATVPGSVLGAYLTSVLSPAVLGLVFGVFLVVVAVRMVFESTAFRGKKGSGRSLVVSEEALFADKRRLSVGVGLSFFGGVASGLLGIGGGVLLVPIMALILLLPMHVVVATSMLTMILTSVAGAAQHYVQGNIDFAYALLLAVGAVVGAQVGAYISGKLSGRNLRRIFAVVLLIVSVQMIIKFV
ncbi:MAG: sulfite exporter TauE/SafE family protein [Candidatus Bathyarchaeia archaeon]